MPIMNDSRSSPPICRFCTGTKTAPVEPPPPRAMWCCEDCQLIFVDESHISDPQAERARYLTHNNRIDDERYVATFAGVRAAIANYAPTAATVLDYGSGPAPVLVELLRRDGYDAVGYDPFFAPALDTARRFDVIACVETAEHFCKPRQEFQQMAGLLRPGGILIVKTQLHGGPQTIKDWWYARDFTHVAFFNKATFAQVATFVGAATHEMFTKDLFLIRMRV